ncbi:MAG: hypothetical protein IPP60_00600 [Sphingobacteriales bacterium]|nr:hypothetical protein [Sphingobacteriales bacterium]
MKKTITILLSISIGLLFIVSAATKIFPMEPFEYQFVDIGVATWKTAPFFARFFIGLEFFLGMLLMLNIALRKFTLKFAIALLSFFCIYLIYKIYTEGNTGNCGCFGEYISMTPLQGILKNMVLIATCVVCYLVTEKDIWSNKWKLIVTPVLFIGAMCLGFFIYPMDAKFSSSMDKTNINYKVPLELMYDSTQTEKPAIDLTKGKHIIAFLSLTCSHCRIAAQKMNIIHKKNPGIPLYFALNGDKELLAGFFDYTHTQAIPHNLFLGAKSWMQVAGLSLPNIMYVENSIVRKKCNGMEIDQEDMEAWLKK